MPRPPSQINEHIQENKLEFWYELYRTDVALPEGAIEELEEAGFITKKQKAEYKPSKVPKIPRELSYLIKNEGEVSADENVLIVDSPVDSTEDLHAVYDYTEYERLKKEGLIQWDGEPVTKADWEFTPEEMYNWPIEFVEWIDSINSGFKNIAPFEKFNKYRQQAYMWQAENTSFYDFDYPEDLEDYHHDEVSRIDENSLYFLNKYMMMKEGQMEVGSHKYTAWKPHEILCFLFDCGISFSLGKGRQIGATTTLGGCFLKRILTRKNYFAKFITEDKDKGEEIFNDKIKFPFTLLPVELRPSVSNDTQNLLAFGKKKRKGIMEGVGSRLQIVAPKKTAINGGSPDLVGIDEQGNIGILSEMLKEARPALLWTNPKTRRIEMRRQVIMWGTAGEAEKGGKAFEREFKHLMGMWEQRDFSACIVPIFFNAYAKPGVDDEFLKKEKATYYQEGEDAEKSRIQFHQHYPIHLDDMFLSSSETLIPITEINDHIDACYQLEAKFKPKHGHFVPEYNVNNPLDQKIAEFTGFKYEVIGARFIPCDEADIHKAPVTILIEPRKGWLNRYYQGTDPISSNTGISDMSSAIWDKYYNNVPAIVKHRSRDHKESFVQCMLMGMYYNVDKELIEGNIGQSYIDWLDLMGLFSRTLPQAMLPPYLHTSGNMVGIKKFGSIAPYIVNKIREMLHSFAGNIRIGQFWVQLKTYVNKISDAGNSKWEPINKKHYRDDVIDAVVYAYICAQCFWHSEPKNLEEEKKHAKTVYKFGYDKDHNLRRKKVKV